MKVRRRIIRFAILTVSLLVIVVLSVAIPLTNDSVTEKTNGLSLIKPAFAQASEASFLEEEAGIAAYVNVGHTIELNRAKSVFRTVEKQTESYIVGSVALPEYEASEDVHVYIDQNGWVVGYYMRGEPSSKIIDWKSYSVGRINTKLALCLEIIANSLGLHINDMGYYHFGYPTANKIMIIVDSAGERITSFKIKIPSSLMFYEGSYSILARDRNETRSCAELWIGEELIRDVDEYDEEAWAYGQLSRSNLIMDTSNDVKIYAGRGPAWASITLVYQE